MKNKQLALWTTCIGFLSVVGLQGCQQIPDLNGKITVKPPEPPKVVYPPYVLNVPPIMNFTEGQTAVYRLDVRVPDPGMPVLMVEGLPAGAVFSQKDMTISWAPDFSAAGNPSDPTEVEKPYPLRFTLRSSQDSITTIERTAMMLVHDVARPTKIELPSDTVEVTEGQDLEQEIRLVNPDFPNGPFDLRSSTLPSGAVIERDSKDVSLYRIKYSPDFTVVTVSDAESRQKFFRLMDASFLAVGPRNERIKKSLSIKVWDVRLKPKLTFPNHLETGSEVSIPVSVEDPNGEESPGLSIDPKPAFGRVRIQSNKKMAGVGALELPTASAVVIWDQIPAEMMGQPQVLNLKACTHNNLWDRDNCITQPLSVTFSLQPHSAPEMDRSLWKLGTIRYLRSGEVLSVKLPIVDTEDRKAQVKVTIEPKELQSEISWSAGVLKVNPTTDGWKQFNIIATSNFGVVKSESFNLRALPASWSDTLILGESPKNPEVAAALKVFPGAQIASPAIGIDEMAFVLRKNLIVGTGVLSLPGVEALVSEAATKIPQLILSSPLLAQMKEFLGNDVKLVGRYLDLPGLPGLSSLKVVPAVGTGLPASVNPVRLGQSLTIESLSPMVLEAGDTGRCFPLLKLVSMLGVEYTAALSCERSGGGKMLVSGFEWADLAPTSADQEIGALWLRKWVQQ